MARKPGITQLVERLPSTYKSWGPSMTLQKLRTLAQDSKPSPEVVEEGGLRTQGHLQLQRELEASAGYMRPQGVGCFSVVCFVLLFSFV